MRFLDTELVGFSNFAINRKMKRGRRSNSRQRHTVFSLALVMVL